MPKKPISTPLEFAWSAVYARYLQLERLDRQLLEIEATMMRAWEAARVIRHQEWTGDPDSFGEKLDEMHRASMDFSLWGEIAFMLSESALNRLAETVAETREPGVAREHSAAFGDLRRWARASCSQDEVAPPT